MDAEAVVSLPAELSKDDRAALDQFDDLQGDLDKFKSFGRGHNDLLGRARRARANSPRPSSVSASLWGRLTPAQKEQEELKVASKRAAPWRAIITQRAALI